MTLASSPWGGVGHGPHLPGPRTLTSMQSASASPWGGVGAMADTRRSAASRCCWVHCRWSVWSSRSGRTTGSSNYGGGQAESHVPRGPGGVGRGRGGPGARTHPELFGLQVLVAPLVLVVVHEGAIRGVLQGPGGEGQGSGTEPGSPGGHRSAGARRGSSPASRKPRPPAAVPLT